MFELIILVLIALVVGYLLGKSRKS